MCELKVNEESLKNVSNKITFLENKIQYLIDENSEMKIKLKEIYNQSEKLNEIISILNKKEGIVEKEEIIEKELENIENEKLIVESDEEHLIKEGVYYLERYLNSEDLTLALDYLGEASDMGNIEASLKLGDIYYKDNIIDDIELAIEYYKRAAYNKSDEGIEKLIQIYNEKGEQGEYKYYHYLADIYYNGELVAKNRDKYMKYYVIAAENEINESINKLIKIYKDSAALKDSEAAFILGEIYDYGEWVERDEEEAYYWFNLAEECGHNKGKIKAGEVALEIADFLYTEEDIKCIEWYNIASEKENREAQYKLGQLFEKGIIVGKDQDRALRLYQKASDNGYFKAVTKIKIIKPVKNLFNKDKVYE